MASKFVSDAGAYTMFVGVREWGREGVSECSGEGGRDRRTETKRTEGGGPQNLKDGPRDVRYGRKKDIVQI